MDELDFQSTADEILFEMTEVFKGDIRPEAVEVLEESTAEVRAWLIRRLEQVGFERDKHEFELEVNKWNEKGYGLQSISVKLLDESGDSLLSNGEWQDPTIGIIAPGMLDDKGKYGITDFPIDEGKAECVTSLSKGGILIGGVKNGAKHKNRPKLLPQDESEIISGNTHKARAVVELSKGANAPRKQLRKVLKKGVYACEFLEGDNW